MFRKNLNLELTGYYFQLNKALVQRRDAAGADFFVNAGDIQQKGVEIHGDYIYSRVRKTFLEYFVLRADYTFSHFRYGNFIKGADDFSGKEIPSVPRHTISFLSDFHFNLGLYLNLSWYNASKIFLNDANTAVAEPYQLLGARVGWRNQSSKKYRLNFYAGADNLLNEKYSLGNDINAAGGRYFNAAALRNYYIGISLQGIKPQAK
jgi:iron complex outermembrane receptor protein